MPKYNGTDLRVYLDDELIGNATEGSLSLELDLPDASDKDSLGWAEHIQGQKSWSMSCTAFLNWQPTGTNKGFEDIATALIGRSGVTVKFSVATGVTQAGAVEYEGSASIASCSLTAPLEDVSSYDVEFTGNGVLTPTAIV